jgi:hypothetical protein
MKPPSTGARVPYRERHFTPSEQARAGHALAFGRDYDNPWLVRALVAPGLRTAQDKLQVDWAEQAVQQSAEGSADLGAALCVLSYRALDRAAGVEGMTLRARVDAYLAAPASSPNAFRWKVSLAYVSALLALEAGKRDRARALLGRVVEDAERTESYSPTLLTKTAEAAWLLGLLSVRDGHPGAAVALWRKVAGVLGVALRRYWSNRAGAPSAPGFELREISMVTSLLGRLEAAATALEEAPGSGALLDDAGHADLVAQVRDADQVWRTKLWLEHQLAQVSAAREWLEENRLATQRYVAELLEGKAWLEGQLEAARGGPGPG